MPTILVVDDSAVDRQWAGGLLEESLDAKVTYAEDGQDALATFGKEPPDLVLTDLLMPNMNGLTLVEQIRTAHPLVPVILMTAHGSDDIAFEALKKGASSYIPKRKLADDLADTVSSILSLAQAARDEQIVLDCMTHCEARYELTNDVSLISSLVGHLERGLKRMKLCDSTDVIRIAVALREALVNAICHGNLELSSELREQGDGTAYFDLLEVRRQQPPYSARRVHVTVTESRTEAIYVIRDEGAGFDPSKLPDPTDPANLEQVSGRGLLLIRTFMDEVFHEDRGREITMILRKQARKSV